MAIFHLVGPASGPGWVICKFKWNGVIIYVMSHICASPLRAFYIYLISGVEKACVTSSISKKTKKKYMCSIMFKLLLLFYLHKDISIMTERSSLKLNTGQKEILSWHFQPLTGLWSAAWKQEKINPISNQLKHLNWSIVLIWLLWCIFYFFIISMKI